MFSIHDQPTKLCDGISRREILRVGGLSVLGLSLPTLLRAREENLIGLPGEIAFDGTFGCAKNVIWSRAGKSSLPVSHTTSLRFPSSADRSSADRSASGASPDGATGNLAGTRRRMPWQTRRGP